MDHPEGIRGHFAIVVQYQWRYLTLRQLIRAIAISTDVHMLVEHLHCINQLLIRAVCPAPRHHRRHLSIVQPFVLR